MLLWIPSTIFLAPAVAVGFAHAPVAQEAPAPRQFSRPLVLEPSSETSANVSFGDLDADGDLDIVLAKGRHWPLVNRVLLNDGEGRFQASDLAPNADRSYSAVLADLDGDDLLDLVVSNDRPDDKRVYFGDGVGGFTKGGSWGAPEWTTRNATVADLDGDGDLDLIAANRGGPSGFCLNDGTGAFDRGPAVLLPSESATSIVAADFDRDGDIDLAIPHRDGGQSHLCINDGMAGFQRTLAFGPPDSRARTAAAGDLDGDGWLDLVVGDQGTGTRVYLGQGQGRLVAGAALGDPSHPPGALHIADLNLDGHADVVVGYYRAGPKPAVFFGDGSGRSFTRVEFGDGRGAVYGIAVGDVDGDGQPDIATARSGAPNTLYYGSRPTETPTLPPTDTSGAATTDTATAPPHGATPDDATPVQRYADWARPSFTAAEYAARRVRVAERLRNSGGGVLLIPSRPGRSHGETFRQLDDFHYFTGLELPDSILAIVCEPYSCILFVPPRDDRFEQRTRANDFPGRPLLEDPALSQISGIEQRMDVRRFGAALQQWAQADTPLHLAAEGARLPAASTQWIQDPSPLDAFLSQVRARHPEARLESAYAAIARVRMIKSPAEIALLRRAVDITAAGIRAAAAQVRPGVDERHLEGVMEAQWKRGGAARRAFDSIIKSGPNSLWPWRILATHYDRRNRAMQDGELVIFDVGCEFDHHVSDVGRTFPVGGRFTPRQRELLDLQRAVANAILAAIEPGVTFPQLQSIAFAAIPREHRQFMQSGSFFGHHLGLSTGDPSLRDLPLEAGMVFTVEPWYYNHIEKIAVFLEDVVLVTEGGAENLSASLPRTAEGLEALVRGGD